jgi:hypothetical protein
MKRGWRTLAVLGGLSLGVYIVHALAARALIDHGVAGALLAGGGGWGTISAAVGFLVLRLACFVGLAVVPAWLVWKASSARIEP